MFQPCEHHRVEDLVELGTVRTHPGPDGRLTLPGAAARAFAAGRVNVNAADNVGANSDSFGGGSGVAAQITAWVKAHLTATTVGGETVYDLTSHRS